MQNLQTIPLYIICHLTHISHLAHMTHSLGSCGREPHIHGRTDNVWKQTQVVAMKRGNLIDIIQL